MDPITLMAAGAAVLMLLNNSRNGGNPPGSTGVLKQQYLMIKNRWKLAFRDPLLQQKCRSNGFYFFDNGG